MGVTEVDTLAVVTVVAILVVAVILAVHRTVVLVPQHGWVDHGFLDLVVDQVLVVIQVLIINYLIQLHVLKIQNGTNLQLNVVRVIDDTMKTAIIGSRSISDYGFVSNELQKYTITHIVSGGARGVDTLAERYAKDNNIPRTVYKPDWKRYGKAAGPIRNRTIVDDVERVIAFWDGTSRGTLDATNYAKSINKLTYMVNI